MRTCLNLGCGHDYRESTDTETWVNVDIDPYVKTDWCGDAQHMPSLDDEKFDYIYSHHSLEHFPDLFTIVDQLARVSKNGATWEIHVPYWSWSRNQGNPHHKIHFSEDTFRFFDKGPNGLHKRRQQDYSITTRSVDVKYGHQGHSFAVHPKPKTQQEKMSLEFHLICKK